MAVSVLRVCDKFRVRGSSIHGVAVTEATGFTGRRVVSELLRRGHEVTAPQK